MRFDDWTQDALRERMTAAALCEQRTHRDVFFEEGQGMSEQEREWITGEAQAQRKAGRSFRTIARDLGMTESTIRRICIKAGRR